MALATSRPLVPRALPRQPLLDPVTGGLAYILYRSIQSSIGILCVLVAFECLLAAGWLWCMRYSAKVSGAPCAMPTVIAGLMRGKSSLWRRGAGSSARG